MSYEIIDNIEAPASAMRGRARGELGRALDSLDVGQGFVFADTRPQRNVYPSVASRKFPTEGGFKRFKLWQVEEGKYGVKRVENRVVAEA